MEGVDLLPASFSCLMIFDPWRILPCRLAFAWRLHPLFNTTLVRVVSRGRPSSSVLQYTGFQLGALQPGAQSLEPGAGVLSIFCPDPGVLYPESDLIQ